MRNTAMVMVACLTLLGATACKRQEAKRGAGNAKAGTGAMGGTTGEAGMGARGAGAGGAASSDGFPELEKLLEKQKAVAKILEGVKSLDDLERTKSEYMELSIEMMELSLASLRAAVKMPKDKLKEYLARTEQMNKANAEFGKSMAEQQARILRIEGAQEFVAQFQKEATEKLKGKGEELMSLMQALTKRQAEMERDK